jgi:hypothetical protein
MPLWYYSQIGDLGTSRVAAPVCDGEAHVRALWDELRIRGFVELSGLRPASVDEHMRQETRGKQLYGRRRQSTKTSG